MSRGIDAGTRATLAAPHVIAFALVEMALDSGTLYLTDCPHDVTYGGGTWKSIRGLGRIEPIGETATEARGLRFALSAVGEASIASALTEPIQGRRVTVRIATLDQSTSPPTLAVDASAWTGALDTMSIEDGPNPVIAVNAEHAMLGWDRAPGQLMTDADHQTEHPGDKFFGFVAAMAEATIVWPDKTWKPS